MSVDIRTRVGRAALLSTQEMARADELAITGGLPSLGLMENAGTAIVHILKQGREPGNLLVLAGPGNNGGDGFTAARLAQEAGWRVRVGLVGESHQLRGDAAEMASRWHGPRRKAGADLIEGTDVVVDAIYGAGLTRPIEGETAALIQAVNRSRLPVLAADMPSGIDGNTGQVRGIAIQAQETVTFFRAKPGHCLMPGRAYCGRLHVLDIGIRPAVLDQIAPPTFHNTPDFWGHVYPRLSVLGHKTSRGHAMVVSGGPLNTGAARLAAEGALRTGAGLVTVLSPPDAAIVNATHLTAVMVAAFDKPETLVRLARDRATALVIGPAAGITEATRANVLALLSLGVPIVLDADVFSVFAARPEELFGALHDKAVLTPHLGEFRRLFPDLADALTTASKAEVVREAARRCGAVVVLKGPDTVAASAGAEPGDDEIAIATNAAADLATAGSGDVLTGLIAGLLAQGMPTFPAACAGVWLHGEAGKRAGRGLIAEDLAPAMPACLTALDTRLNKEGLIPPLG